MPDKAGTNCANRPPMPLGKTRDRLALIVGQEQSLIFVLRPTLAGIRAYYGATG